MTNLKAGALYRRTNGQKMPEYTPDFVNWQKVMVQKGIRVTKRGYCGLHLNRQKKTKVPTLIEFIIDPEELVYPMVKPNGTLEDMIMDC